MTLFFIILSLIVILFIRRLARKKRVDLMLEKPYRYQLDTRRSPWAYRSKF